MKSFVPMQELRNKFRMIKADWYASIRHYYTTMRPTWVWLSSVGNRSWVLAISTSFHQRFNTYWIPNRRLLLLTINLFSIPWTKWPPFHRRHFQTHFLVWKSSIFDWNFTEVCSYGFKNPALVQIMAWRRIGDKPLSEAMLTWFTDYIYAALGGDGLKTS